MGEAEHKRMVEHGKRHLEFCIKLYREQMRNGLYFLHEHPDRATSWQHQEMQKLLKEKGVQRVTEDMCQFGMVQYDVSGEGYIKKPTGWATNAEELAKILGKRCPGEKQIRHRHINLMSSMRTKKSQEHSDEIYKKYLKFKLNIDV